ncbi:distal membrane-arm assembly complex protein 2-like isoform X5 [Hyla sarda]|uniref:distal membrane-arm assembly complex protein 2-like isoform X5 n=1 Tax=Hyla sarda TaxID=327740 RepID=UPI0024C4352A|nr:distal membrane-arm assembly complex protein 2-like isoform X5 [Hyla sarda]XP_056393783.1 distal membrane-arm assembly complex protein 2-like isoform X5 [Hyla sarda]XP_056393784.1 distal membrane-arm assembly complex protein 2-like isoform X5 [Hyla sarda]XP_056393785.1 distal membrane-arm assembly complex protein 2-like isoform X5 [Hyla sarda]XP_056393786.1 distal membrane-arm assembly complex protein 2-like isoform X5 [Hyla sarda]
MAAPRLMQSVRVLPAISHGILRYSSSSATSETKEKVRQYLMDNVPAVYSIMKWNNSFKLWRLKNKNERAYFTEGLYGKIAAAAHLILEQKGGVRFKGHTEWFRPNHKGRYFWDFLQYKNVPIECVDLSGSMATYMGLSNLEGLQELRELNLSRCHYIDDWALSRLHVFKDSLEVLSLAGCRQVTERGLATLHHLQNLKRLDLSDLPAVNNKGLVLILLEEVLPHCEIVGIEYTDGLHSEEMVARPESMKSPGS